MQESVMTFEDPKESLIESLTSFLISALKLLINCASIAAPVGPTAEGYGPAA